MVTLIKKCVNKVRALILITIFKIMNAFLEISTDDYLLLSFSTHPIFHNWGDDVNPVLVKFIAPNKKFIPLVYSWNIKRKNTYLCVGSGITWMATSYSIIWGSGVVYPEKKLLQKPLKVLAVRGPLTRKYLLDNGVDCPEIYGDPALLFPRYYLPKTEKKYKLGIIPHFRDKKNPLVKKLVNENNAHFIDVQNVKNWRYFINEINSCEFILSSSLHGVIISDAYKVPNCWAEFENGENKRFAFRDYFLSVTKNIESPIEIDSSYSIDALLALKDKWQVPVIDLDKLMSVGPFNN